MRITYPDAHNLSANVLDEVFGGVQREFKAGTRADLRVGNATRPRGAGRGRGFGAERSVLNGHQQVDRPCGDVKPRGASPTRSAQ